MPANPTPSLPASAIRDEPAFVAMLLREIAAEHLRLDREELAWGALKEQGRSR